jgi:integrase
MAIFKRGRIYWYHFIFNGQHIQRSTKQGNPRVARQIEAAYRTKLAKGEVGIEERKPAPPFDFFARDFLQLVEAVRAPKTRRCYDSCLKNLKAHFSGKRLDEITAEHIKQYKLKRLDTGRRNATVNRDLACLRRMFRLAVKWGRLARSPFSDGAVEFLPEQGRERILSFEEERRYLEAANPTLRDVATILTEAGMRPEELFTLRHENVHMPERYIHIPGGKTKNAKRDVFLTEAADEVIKRRLAAAKGPYLFPKRRGQGYDWSQPMTSIQKAHEEALAKSRITPQFRLYDLRHTYGTRAAEAGTDPLTLMRLMGHADLKTTQRYVHLSKRHLVEAQKKLEAYKVERILAEAGEPTSDRPQ